MKKCLFCGTLNDDNNKFCTKCGYKFDDQEKVNEQTINNEASVVTSETTSGANEVFIPKVSVVTKKNNMATVAFILSLISLGLFFSFITIPYAIVTSIFTLTVAIISLTKKAEQGKFKSIFGIVVSSIILILSIIIFAFGDSIVELVTEMLNSYCDIYPNSDECIMLKESLPNIFK